MRTIFSTVISLLVFTSVTIAQNDTIKYENVIDDPFDIPKLYVNISPLVYSASSNMNFSFGLKSEFNIKDKVNIRENVEIQYPYASMLCLLDLMDSEYYKYKLTNEQLFDVGFDITLSDKIREINSPITISATGSYYGNVTVIHSNYIQVSMKHRKLNRLRFGGIKRVSNYTIGEKDEIYTTNGTIFNNQASDESYSFESGNIIYPDIQYDSLYAYEGDDYYNTYLYSEENGTVRTKADFIGVYIGYSATNVYKKIIDVKDYGLRGIVTYKTFYVDGMFGKSTLSPFMFMESNPSATIIGDEIGNELIAYTIDTEASDLKPNMFGFRMGWAYHYPMKSKKSEFEVRSKVAERPAYFTFYHEFGLYPGYGILQNLYYKIGLNIELNAF